MTWRRHFRRVTTNNSDTAAKQIQAYQNLNSAPTGTSSKYSSYLPEVYAGHPNRIQRYYQYDDMDRDSDINAALDTIADFCTQSEEQNESPFIIHYNEEANETEVKLLTSYLKKWTKINDFKKRLWYIFRGCIKYGDQFFLRDPETGEWLWLDHYTVEMVKVDADRGKEPDEYIIRGLDYNRAAKYASGTANPADYRTPFGATAQASGRPASTSMTAGSTTFNLAGSHRDIRQQQRMQNNANQLYVVDAKHVVHLSLSGGGFDINWPFGTSILEPIYKTYKQKELLEDSIIIYRVQRAPERRVFYIDVGNMPPVRARAHIEQIKNEIHQRRIPNRTGGGNSIIDAAYNPLCLDMNTRIPLLDGRTLTIRELAEEYQAGKENWVYSCDPITGKIVPGNITWAGVTQKSAKVIRIILDNGETLTCTPDHKIPVIGKGFVEAKDLTPDDQLIAFDTRIENGSLKVFDYTAETWVDADKIVADFFKAKRRHQEFTFLSEHASSVKDVLLHRDFDAFNNDPRNLAYMHHDDYTAYRYMCDRHFRNTLSADQANTYFKKIETEMAQHDPRPGMMEAARRAAIAASIKHPEPETYRGAGKIVAIEDVAEPIEVGTITVDGNERWQNFHTFAISGGIFVKNSILEDYFFAQSCLRLDTKLPLLDGRTLTLADVISEYEQGKVNWTYSIDPKTHKLEPGKIVWAGVTRRDAEMVRVTLDNGEYVDATPDHRFVLRDGTEVQAGDLKPGDSLMPLYLFEGRTGPKQKNAGYTRYLCNATGKKRFVHTDICPKPKGREYVVHHKDFNPRNNNPDNLEVMTWADHEALHKAAGSYSFSKQWNDPIGRAKLIAGMRRLYDTADENFRAKLADRNRKNGAAGNRKYVDRVSYNFTDTLFAKLTDAAVRCNFVKKRVADALNRDEDFMAEFTALNSGRVNSFGHVLNKFEIRRIDALCRHAGYENWQDFKKSYARNHKVVGVEILPYREDTGDITIETPSGGHLFALAAGIFVHNSDGRGSKVETLPGADSVGEIGDLTFFTKKLARGLRIPSSYLSLGEDENRISYNDGKLGAALIEEFRFNKYCMRFQNLLAPVFDAEFKRFLKDNGIEIDPNLFEVTFCPPQNFTKYREIEIKLQQVQLYSQIAGNKRLSERFKLMHFLGLTEDQLIENETLWREENAEKLRKVTGSTPAEADSDNGDLTSIGIRPQMDIDITNMGGPDLPPEGEEMPSEEGGMGVAPSGAAPPAGTGDAGLGGMTGGGLPGV